MPTPTLQDVIQRLAESEINFSVRYTSGVCWEIRLGDELNGYDAELFTEDLDRVAEFLDRKAREHYPKSLYVIGREEFNRQARELRESYGGKPATRTLDAPS
jgi:hypothetical protein